MGLWGSETGLEEDDRSEGQVAVRTCNAPAVRAQKNCGSPRERKGGNQGGGKVRWCDLMILTRGSARVAGESVSVRLATSPSDFGCEWMRTTQHSPRVHRLRERRHGRAEMARRRPPFM